MVVLLAFIAVVSFLAVNGASLSSGSCAVGPSYWCSSVIAAKECSAMQYCLDNNWSADGQVTKVEKVDPQACSLCKKLIQDTKDFISSQSTLEMVEQYLAQACQLFTDDFMVNECKTIEDHYLRQVLAMVEAQLDPVAVCTAANICGTNTTSPLDFFMKQMSKIIKQEVGNDYCSMCESAVDGIHSFTMMDGTQESVEKFLMSRVCPALIDENLVTMCTQSIERSFPQIWSASVAALADPKAMCTDISLCPMVSTPVVEAIQLPVTSLNEVAGGVGNASVCDICKDAVALLDRELEDAKAMAGPAIEQLCQKLGPLNSLCENLANQVVEAIFDTADQLFNDGSCSKWNLCAVGSGYTSKKVYGDDKCSLCKRIMSNLYGLASTKGIENYVRSSILRLGCAALENEADLIQCKKAVDAAVVRAWSAMVSELQKLKDTCADASFCISAQLNNAPSRKAQNVPWYQRY